MGALLSMYGGASKALEQEIEKKKQELAKLKKQLDEEKVVGKRHEIRQKIKGMETAIAQDTEKLKQLLKGAAKTTGDAALSLSEKLKSKFDKVTQKIDDVRKKANESGKKFMTKLEQEIEQNAKKKK